MHLIKIKYKNKKSRHYTRILLERRRPLELSSSLSSLRFCALHDGATVYGQNRDAAFLKIIHSFCQMLAVQLLSCM